MVQHPRPGRRDGATRDIFRNLALIGMAGLWAVTSPSQVQTAPKSKVTQAPTPSVKPQGDAQPRLYRNAAFGFRYQVPFGWVDRTKEMSPSEKDAVNASVLLAAFERPPEAFGDTVNAAVVIESESVAAYPGLKKAEDYLGPLSEVATAKGFRADGEPYALEVESKQLIRADFIKQLNQTVSMRQCTLVLFTKGQIVSFTFIASGEDELDHLMDSLHFDVKKSSSR